MAIAMVTISSASLPATTLAATVEGRVAASTDDAEEFANGTMSLVSSDLELVNDGTDQTVGMRWAGLAIPPGATITAAYIQFTAKDPQTVATSLAIRGQAADNAATFGSTAFEMSARPRTTATASWAPAAWVAGEAGANQRTPDLSAVIQEVVSRGGWASGNALVILINGTGHRTAWSFNGNAPAAPLLHVEYTTGGASPPTARIAVTQLSNPALTAQADGSASTAGSAAIASYRFDFGDGTAAVITTAPTATAQHTYAVAGTYTVSLIVTDTGGNPSTPATQSINVVAAASPPTARLSASQLSSPALTAQADGSASTAGSAAIASYRFTFGDGTPAVTTTAPTATAQHTYAAAGTYTVSLIATDTGGNASTPATASVTVTAATASTVERRVAVSADDAEESASGSTTLNSSDLELVFDSSNQTVGMRWAGLAIPPGATITAAYIQFTADEAQSEATSLAIRGQAADNAATFASTAGNVSTRPRTTATASWTPVAWVAGEVGANQRTPDLSAVVQEIVSRPGWASGNALAIVITGTGHRTAVAFDGNGAAAPLLHVEFTTAGGGGPPTARLSVTQLSSPALTVQASGSASTAGSAAIASYRFTFGDGTAAVTTTAPTATAQHTYAAAGTYTVTLVVTDTGGNASAPATQSITVTAPTGTTIEKRVAASSDDAEQSASGSVSVSNNDLELVFDSSIQTVGMRWTSLAIPQGSTISAAYIQFSAKEAQSEATNLTFQAQAADNAATFTTSSGSISSRPRTTAAITWSPVAWVTGEAGANQRTPDLKAVLQQIVDRAGWASGNALAIIVTGTGHRTAWSFDGSSGAAPLLHVEYGPATNPRARLAVTQLSSPALTVQADGSASTAGAGGPIASYRFDFGDGTSAVTTTAPTATAQHTYAAAGTYTVTLIVTDTAGNASAPATATVNVASTVAGIKVYVGYYDTHHAENPKPKPDPWKGSSGVVFVGKSDNSSGGWDSSALRIDNLTGATISSVSVTVDIGSSYHFALWGTNSIPAGQKLILAQTGFENFDGSDTSPAGCYGCNPKDCLTKVVSTVPVVHVTYGGKTTHYYDSGQVLNTKGADGAGCPYTGGRNDESQAWVEIAPQLPAGAQVAATNPAQVELAPAQLELSLGRPTPNPATVGVTLRFVLPKRGPVHLAVYDITGRLVKTSIDGVLDAGEYIDHISLNSVPAGVYYYQLHTPERSLHQKFVHVR